MSTHSAVRRERATSFTAAFAYRNYRRVTLANLVSITGTWMQLVAQNWLVLRITGTAAAVGVTVALQALPTAVLGIWGGVVADRLPRRRVLVVTQSLFATLAVVLALTTATGAVTIGLVYTLALLLGIVMAVDGPTGAAFGAELVPEPVLHNAIALGGVCNGVGRILGMSLAGVLVALVGPAPLFFLNAVSYVAVVVVIMRLRDTELRHVSRATGRDAGLRAGVGYAMRTPAIVIASALAFAVAAFGRNYQVTMAAMSRSVFAADARGYGLLSVVFAVGAFAGGVAAARIANHTLRTLVLVAATGSALQVVSGLAPSLPAFAACIAPIAVIAVVFDTGAQCVVQTAAGDANRGRVVALFGAVSMLGAAAGGPGLGALADHAGGRASLVVGGSIVLAATAVVAAIGIRYAPEHRRVLRLRPAAAL